MNCIIFVFATASLIVGCNSHAKKNATISTVKNDAIRARIDGPSAPPGGDYTIGDPESIKRFGQWSARDRALALIAADNGLYYSSNPMQPRTIPYVAASRANGGIPIKEYYQTYHPNPDDQRRFENLTKTITGGHCSESILIPTHPDTVSQHPVIQGILRKGHENIPKNTYPGLVAYNTMSRSMAVLNQDPQNGNLPLLFGLKVGSDKVANTHQPGKLSGVHWNARYVNALSDPTSVHALAEKYGIAIVSDSIGLVYGQDYGVVLRDYDSLLAEKDYFFIPLMAFQEKLIKRGSPTNGSGTYFWNIYKPGRSNVFDKNKSILRIVASREHVEKFIDELSEEMGKLIAIYYLNGVSSLDLHGQNLLVGIPLDPQRQAMLAVRDISDHWVFPYAPTGYIQLKYGPIPEPNWCRALYQGSAGIGSSCSRRSQDLTLMGFRKIAQGTGFDLGNEISPKTTSDIYNTLLGNPERYGPMIRKVRQMEIPPKVAGCLRSAGCPQARGLLTP